MPDASVEVVFESVSAPSATACGQVPTTPSIMLASKIRGKALITLILVTSGIDFLEFGYDQGLLGGILSRDRFQNMIGHPTPTMEGLLSAIYCLGCVMGAGLAFVFGDRMGRVGTIRWANVIVIMGGVIQTACYNYWQMFASRVIAGIGIGMSTVAVPILQAETLPPRNRGAMLVFQTALANSGVAVASWVSFACLFADSSAQWRIPIAMQVLFSLLVLTACAFIPETPRWLASRGRNDEARAVLAQLANTTDDDSLVNGQLQEIVLNVQEEGVKDAGWSETFRNRTPMRNLQRVCLGLGPYMMNQWSGINSITYYMTYTLQNYLGYTRNMALVLASVAFTQFAIFSFPPYFFIDRIGRRWTIMISSMVCSGCLMVVAGCLMEVTHARAAAAVAFMFLFIDSFGMGILPVSWSYSSEIQPLATRNTANAVGVAGHWLSNFVVVFVTPAGLNSIQGNYYWIWAIVNASFVPIVYFFGVETAGRSLEMVDQDFFDEPRVLMGLNKRHRKVLRFSEQDEENRFRQAAFNDAKEVTEASKFEVEHPQLG